MKTIVLILLLLILSACVEDEKKDLEYWRVECTGDWKDDGDSDCSDREVQEYVKRLGWPNQIED